MKQSPRRRTADNGRRMLRGRFARNSLSMSLRGAQRRSNLRAPSCHCEERSDEAIPMPGEEIASLRSQ